MTRRGFVSRAMAVVAALFGCGTVKASDGPPLLAVHRLERCRCSPRCRLVRTRRVRMQDLRPGDEFSLEGDELSYTAASEPFLNDDGVWGIEGYVFCKEDVEAVLSANVKPLPFPGECA